MRFLLLLLVPSISFADTVIVSDITSSTIAHYADCTITQFGMQSGDASTSVISADCESVAYQFAGMLEPAQFYSPFSLVTVYERGEPFQSKRCNIVGQWIADGVRSYAFQCF